MMGDVKKWRVWFASLFGEKALSVYSHEGDEQHQTEEEASR